VLERTGATEWCDAVCRLVEDVAYARGLGRRARAAVARRHRMSRQIDLLHETYERIHHGDTLRLG